MVITNQPHLVSLNLIEFASGFGHPIHGGSLSGHILFICLLL